MFRVLVGAVRSLELKQNFIETGNPMLNRKQGGKDI